MDTDLGLEKLLNHKNVEHSADGKNIRLRLPLHKDNVSMLAPRMAEKVSENFYATAWVPYDSMHTAIALEGPIFRAAPQLLHMSLAIEGLKQGYLFADPMTFAEEFEFTGMADLRRNIYNSWSDVITNTSATVAMIEYGNGYDPGVVIGAVRQLMQGKPVLGLSLNNGRRDDVFSNSIDTMYLSHFDVESIIEGDSAACKKVLDKVNRMNNPDAFPKKGKSFGYNPLIIYENTMDGIITANNVYASLHGIVDNRLCGAADLGDISDNFSDIDTLYDLADYISKSDKVLILGDNTCEVGVIGASALQIASEMNVHVDMLRGDFRALIGEGKGAGSGQPSKGLFEAQNLMVEYLLPRGAYTKIEALVEDMKR
jgi:hypothetical protein